MADGLDRRRHPIRADLAAGYLRERVSAPRYADPVRRAVISETAPIRQHPDAGAMQISELLHGEPVDVYAAGEGWVWAQGVLDGYVGYVAETDLADAGTEPTHLVRARLSHLFPEASIKRPPAGRLTLGARVAVTEVSGKFARLADGRFVIAEHLRPLGEPETDVVAVALRNIGAPYLWGGRSSLGLDCSGLVQVACQACGLLPPRDSDMQSKELGVAKPVPKGPEALERGDVVYFPGHCMIADGAGGLVHANATHMMVTHEPAGEVFARTPGGWSAVTDVRARPAG